MTPNNCRIICASAGTGKTYRLSVEYLSLILKYYGKIANSLWIIFWC
jgi:ATP-dependent exoDNAse (exonuclease V) beta subunit